MINWKTKYNITVPMYVLIVAEHCCTLLTTFHCSKYFVLVRFFIVLICVGEEMPSKKKTQNKHKILTI